MSIKKRFLAIFLSAFILAGCGGGLSSLTSEEKSLYDANTEAGNSALGLSQALNMAQDENPDYATMWEKAQETSQALAKSERIMGELELGEETAQILENSTINVEATSRIVEKVKEITSNGKAMNMDEGAEMSPQEVEEMLTSLNGFKGRLEKSKEKFDNLNEQLLEDSATNN